MSSETSPADPGSTSPSATVPVERSGKKVESATIVNGDLKVDTHPQSVVQPRSQPKTLGRYSILGELGRGGMGAVYLAEDSVLKRKVALKIPQFDADNADQMQARFLREAQMAAQLSHPNICQIFDVSIIDGQYVMPMEYIEGRTLAAFTKPEKLLTERQVALLGKKVALAVEVAHQKGLIHRDLKPGNIMLPKPDPVRRTMEPKVMDFGLAKNVGRRGTELTKSGMIVGTPCYMSKEQWSDKDAELGPPSDVYSLGVILYELLTGQLPFQVDDDEPLTTWFVRLITESPRRLSQHKPESDAVLESIVMKAIAREPEDRFSSMSELASALDEWLRGKPVTGQTFVGMSFDASAAAAASKTATPNAGNGWNRFVGNRKLLSGGLGGGAALLLGIIIVLTDRNGRKTVIPVPADNSVTVVESTQITEPPDDETKHGIPEKPAKETAEVLESVNPSVAESIETTDGEGVPVLGNQDSHSVPKHLDEILVPGTVLPGVSYRKGSEVPVNDFTLTILNRENDSIDGWYDVMDRDGDFNRRTRFSGTVTENDIDISSNDVRTPFIAQGSLQNGELVCSFLATRSRNEYLMRVNISKRPDAKSREKVEDAESSPGALAKQRIDDTKLFKQQESEVVVIQGKDAGGYDLGAIEKGDCITLQYVSGKWKGWGRFATESPDTSTPERGDACRLAIGTMKDDVFTRLAIVSEDTQQTAFEWIAPKSFQNLILRMNDPDGNFDNNPDGAVVYSVQKRPRED